MTTAAELPTAVRPKQAAFVPLDELERMYLAQPKSYVVEGLLPADDVHVAVGDSGLGKTAWAYQIGLSVAAGKPVFGHNVRQGRVIYFDMENGPEEIVGIGRSLGRHLQLTSPLRDFLVLSDQGIGIQLEQAVSEYKPSLTIVDTLRAYNPEAEKKNEDMGRFLAGLRRLARSAHCAVLLLHHIRKPSENGAPPLTETPTLEWLLQASGARALINQTNTRIGLDLPRNKAQQVVDELSGTHSEAALVMRSFVKVRGDSEPLLLGRVLDATGEPLGYKRMSGTELLSDANQRIAFTKLPLRFTFKEAKVIYDRSDDPTNKWLKKCEAAGLITKTARGQFERLIERVE